MKQQCPLIHFILYTKLKRVEISIIHCLKQMLFTEARTDIAGADPSRIEWVNYNGDEGQIPTMRKGDSIIYKSSTSVPLEYTLEKFLMADIRLVLQDCIRMRPGKYRYTNKDGPMCSS